MGRGLKDARLVTVRGLVVLWCVCGTAFGLKVSLEFDLGAFYLLGVFFYYYF